MNLLYLLASLAGVGLLVGLNVLLMGRARASVDEAAAAGLLASEHPGFRAARCSVAAKKDAALVEDETGGLYVVTALGDRLVSRKLSPDIVRNVSRDGAALAIGFSDMTFPQIRIVLAGEDVAREWDARIARLPD